MDEHGQKTHDSKRADHDEHDFVGLCIAWLELCIASNSRARSAEKASCIDCNPLASASAFCVAASFAS